MNKSNKLGWLNSTVFPSVITVCLMSLFFTSLCSAQTEGAPYPNSTLITGVEWHWKTFDKRAPGSDIWPITWSDDGQQYTAWGDGGGFRGTNSLGRVPLGVARISGVWHHPEYTNVWGGHETENPATVGGKAFGLISIESTLYMWWAGGKGDLSLTKWGSNTILDESRIVVSRNHGRSWKILDWKFSKSDLMCCGTFLNFGKDNVGSRDNYVYSYFPRLNRVTDVWSDDARVSVTRKPGRADLIRVPKDQMEDKNAYEFFAGLDDAGVPVWTKDLSDREPVFEDANGFRLVACTYNAGLKRYLLTVLHAKSGKRPGTGNLGVFEGKEPWGPWKTVYYKRNWGAENGGPGEITGGLSCYFAPKFLSQDGKDFTLVFTDDDHWASVRGRFVVEASTK